MRSQIKWISGFYLFAPKPTDRSSPYYQSHRIGRGWIYYFGQYPIYYLTKKMADFVFVTSQPDVDKFPQQKTFVIRGGVDIPQKVPQTAKKFDAIFIGRLHVQKGILELIDIWSKVVKNIPSAKLAIVGDGELKNELITKIKKAHLQKNTQLFGYVVGQDLDNLINQSRIVVHPATYDSGGMAAAHAMAWGLPGVSFDLEALKTYYPQGMLKTKCYDQSAFAKNIIRLLQNTDIYQEYSQQATILIKKEWGWKNRIPKLYQCLLNSK